MKAVKLVEVAPGRWKVDKPRHKAARSHLSLPYVISDCMPETEQVDGKFYTSKRAFRAVGRSLGLTEVGNEKLKPKTRASASADVKTERRRAIKRAVEKVMRP